MESIEAEIQEKVGIREFRENLATYLLESKKPVTITRHGETVGIYLPVRRKRSDADWAKLMEVHEELQQEMARAGVTEDDIIADFEELRKAQRG